MAEGDNNCGGHECDFVDPPPKELECSICLNVLREPCLNDCCGQHFCQVCIQRIIQDNKPCPLCNEKFTVILDKKTQRKISELPVKCQRHSNGCEWVGELKCLEEHCNDCGYVEVDCQNDCGEKVQRQLLSSHLESECSKRHFKCAYCGHESTHGDITMEHWPKCDQFPISCKNSCGAESIPRCKEEKHRLEDCPLQEVECKYEYAGCDVKIKRKEIDTHMEREMKKHLELMECHADNTKRRLEEESKSIQVSLVNLWSINSTKLGTLERTNITYTEDVSYHHVCKRLSVSRSSIMDPLYDACYRMQFWVYPSEDSHLAVAVSVLGGHYRYDTKWPLKAIVAVELLHPNGSRQSVSQSKLGVWHEPRGYNDSSMVTFSHFVAINVCEHYATQYSAYFITGRELRFKIYLCQPPGFT